jgi:hypothetical protein
VSPFTCFNTAKEASLTTQQKLREKKMTTPFVLGIALCITLIVWAVRQRRRTAQLRIQRARYIAEYTFPASLRFKLDQGYPDLSGEQVGMILQGLRVWFQLVAANPRTQLGMPSHAVDKAWHEFILITKNYADFCEKAFGKFLHHTPHSVGDKAQKDGLARTYGLGAGLAGGAALVGVAGIAGAAAFSGRDLFNIDQTLGVPGGNSYTANDFSEFEKRYQQMQASSGDGGGDTGTTGSDSHHSSDSSSDGGGGDGGGGGGCGGGCS